MTMTASYFKDACQMNESFVFYTSQDIYGYRFSDFPTNDRQGPTESSQWSHHILSKSAEGSKNSSGHRKRSPADLQKSSSHDSGISGQTYMSSAASDLSQRWQDFCEELSFSVRGKVFIMESNFRRRLHALHKYLNKRLAWIVPNKAANCQAQRAAAAAVVNSIEFQSASTISGTSSAAMTGSRKSNRSINSSERLNFGRFRFPEPNSAKSLGAQEECLLNRLEKIKRSSQKLFTSDAEEGEDDNSEPNLVGFTGHNQRQRCQSGGVASDVVEDEDEAIEFGTGGQLMLESSILSNSADRILDDSQAATRMAIPSRRDTRPVSRLVRLASRMTSSLSTRTSGRDMRSCWISRSSKQIKDKAFALTSSKKSCIVCYERTPNIVTLPCKHSDICSDCFIEIIFLAVKHSQYPLRCVLCRQRVERIRCSRRLLLSVIGKKRSRNRK